MVTDFAQTIESYAKSLKTKMKIEQKSENTISAYMRTFRDFAEFSKEHSKKLTLENLKEMDINAFIEYKSARLNKQGEISEATKNAIIAHLKKLFKYIERNSEEDFDSDRVLGDIKMAAPERKAKGLSLIEEANGKNDINKVVDYLNHLKSTKDSFIAYRNSLLFKVLVHGGLRASELLSLKFSNFENIITGSSNMEMFELQFKGKGRKDRITYIRKILIVDEIDILLNELGLTRDDYIAKTSRGKTMDRSQLFRMLGSLYSAAGIKEKGIHILRHTFAKGLVKSGANITTVQYLMGHKSINTTSIYMNPTKEMVISDLARSQT